MPTIEDLLRRAGSEDRMLFRAELLDAKHPEERRRLESLLANPRTRVSDTLLEQLSELLSSREPSTALGEMALAERVRQQLAGPAWAYGVWAHYPWDERLVHVLPEREFFELRTDRNRHKITSAEQRRLRELRIGVIGLSAGQAIAITLAQEGIGSSYRLADFDRLTLSNTNRVRARVHELGLPKPVMTARAIAEIDPYVKVEIFPAGFGRENAEAFFEGDSMDREAVERGGERLDFLIEVCDSIDVKALARIEARERRVPVLMVNSEGGILDIERFDLEPDRPIFHGLAPAGIDPLALAGADLDTKVAYLLPIVGLDNLSDRMVASLVEAGSTVSTWPQLASGVMLGAALMSSAVRRIALGELRDSGRYAVSLDAWVADGKGEHAVVPQAVPQVVSQKGASVRSRRRVPAEPEVYPISLSPTLSPGRGRPPAAAEHADLRAIAAAALAAPSGGNAQPCSFVIDGHCLEIHRRRAAAVPAFDPDDDAAWIAAGAATENAVLAAGALGWGSRIELAPRREPELPLVRIGFAPASLPADPLASSIDRRCTNRKRADPTPLAAADLDLLHAAAAERGARLELITEAPRRARLADCIGAADRLRLLSPAMLRDLAGELRWTVEEVERTRDGIDVRALELRAGELASLRLMLRAPAMAFLRTIGGGDRIRRLAQGSIADSPVLGVVACEGGSGVEPFFRGGRAIERLWLRASERGFSLAPMTTLLFLMRLAERTPSPLSAEERREALELKRAFDEIVPMPRGALPVFLFRLGRAQPPAARSIRKHLDDLLIVRT